MNNFNLTSFNVEDLSHIWEDFDPDFNLPLIVGLSTGLGVLFLGLLILTLYFSFFSTGSSIFLGSNFNIPGEFDDEESRINDEAEYLPKFTDVERESYFEAREFQETNLPQTNPIGSTITEEDREYITDRGIQAYSFQQENVSSLSSSIPSVIIEDKLDVIFTSDDANSAILNFPLPMHDNETVYFEVKLFEFSEESHVAIGVATKPYPGFRLPGYNKYSIAYESNGTVRVNQPFYSPQIWAKLIEGDVLGVGYKPRSGTVFFTHNGKKLLEAVHNVRMDLFPIVGSQGSAKLNVNLGQLGFVFIEANVKKWGFGSVHGTIGIPPAYGKETGNDTVLDKGEELPPNYPSEEETFFGPSALLTRQQQQEQLSSTFPIPTTSSTTTRPTKIISSPPSYSDEPKPTLDRDTPAVNENVDEVRERLYERISSTFDQQNNDYDPLAQSSEHTPKPQGEEEIQEQPNSQELHQEDKFETKESKQVEQTVQEPITFEAEPVAAETAVPNQDTPKEPELEQNPEPEHSSSAEPESSTAEATPEPGSSNDCPMPSKPSSSNKNKNKKKKKKNNKKKGRK